MLVAQAKCFDKLYSTLTLGGRRKPETGVVYIDIGTTTDDWTIAKALGSFYDQRTIRDSHERVNIPL
jgi:hypothetical protein